MKLKCLICGDIIELKSVHDLISCKCGACYIDGGQDCLHFGGKDFDKILIIFNDWTEILASDEILIKRPLLISDKGIFIGFKEETWKVL